MSVCGLWNESLTRLLPESTGRYCRAARRFGLAPHSSSPVSRSRAEGLERMPYGQWPSWKAGGVQDVVAAGWDVLPDLQQSEQRRMLARIRGTAGLGTDGVGPGMGAEADWDGQCPGWMEQVVGLMVRLQRRER